MSDRKLSDADIDYLLAWAGPVLGIPSTDEADPVGAKVGRLIEAYDRLKAVAEAAQQVHDRLQAAAPGLVAYQDLQTALDNLHG